MELFEAMETRSSRRAFLPRPVEKTVLERLIAASNRSPSYQNTQPWELFVATGEKKDAVAARMRDSVVKGAPMEPHIPFAGFFRRPQQPRPCRPRNGASRPRGSVRGRTRSGTTKTHLKTSRSSARPA